MVIKSPAPLPGDGFKSFFLRPVRTSPSSHYRLQTKSTIERRHKCMTPRRDQTQSFSVSTFQVLDRTHHIAKGKAPPSFSPLLASMKFSRRSSYFIFMIFCKLLGVLGLPGILISIVCRLAWEPPFCFKAISGARPCACFDFCFQRRVREWSCCRDPWHCLC